MNLKNRPYTIDFPRITPIFNHEDGGGHNYDEESESGVATVEREKVKPPRRYKVLLHNDDYTTMEFVIYVLQKIFNKTQAEAERIMLKVHQEGVGICGIYTYEIAETKTQKVLKEAKAQGHPLLCSFEPE